MPAEEKTEAATPRRRSELRKKGQVSKSHDLASMIVLVGTIVCIHAMAGAVGGQIQRFLQSTLAGMPRATLTPQTLAVTGGDVARVLLTTVGPFVLTALLLGILANTAQTGFLLAPQAMTPDFKRLNPLNGVKRLVSGRGAVEALKSMGKLAIIAWIAYTTILASYPQVLMTIRKPPVVVTAEIGELIYRLSLRITLFLLALAALDYAYQRWAFEKSIRMTKEEVRQESKNTEGDPKVKARIRARQRQIARRRMMQAVPTADVIVTNPTHFAVALKYDPAAMAAPTVVAKGTDLIAQRIRELAAEHDVPVVENPPLARTLYRTIEIGRQIPTDLFAAVAEVLAFVYQINKRQSRVKTPA